MTHPLDNARRVKLVWGYHSYVPPPPEATENRLSSRFAIVFDAWPKYSKSSLVDKSIFFPLLFAIAAEIPHRFVSVPLSSGRELDSLAAFRNADLQWESPGVDNVDARVLFIDQSAIVAVAEPEPWYQCGGPELYGDSYTLAIYLGDEHAARLRDVCFRTCDALGVLVSCYVAAARRYVPPEAGGRMQRWVRRLFLGEWGTDGKEEGQQGRK